MVSSSPIRASTVEVASSTMFIRQAFGARPNDKIRYGRGAAASCHKETTRPCMLYFSATYFGSQAMLTVGSVYLKGIRHDVKIRTCGSLLHGMSSHSWGTQIVSVHQDCWSPSSRSPKFWAVKMLPA